jgi:hypothetical protein
LPNCGRPEGRPFQSAILSSHNFSSCNNFSLAQFFSRTIVVKRSFFQNAFFQTRFIFSKRIFLKTHFSQNAAFLRAPFFSNASLSKRQFFKAGIVSKLPFKSEVAKPLVRSSPLTMSGYGQILNRQIELRANG